MVATTMTRFDRVDRRITEWMAAHGVTLLRIALGVVFLWFGALKLVPGLSPAETLAGRTIETLTLGVVPASVAVPILALWEVAIGIGLLVGRWMRVTLALLFVQMLGTITPLFLFPAETWVIFPIAPDARGPVHHQEHRAGVGRDRAGRHGPRRRARPEPVQNRSS